MDSTMEMTEGDYHLDPLNNFGLDFQHVLSHFSNSQNIPPDALSSDAVSSRLGASFDPCWFTDVLRPEQDNQSPGLVTVTRRSDLSHDAQHGSQLIFLSSSFYPVIRVQSHRPV